MAIETSAHRPAAAIWRLPATIAGLARFVRVILKTHRAVNELNDLSDRDLSDIGIGRQQIAEVVKREVTRNLLLEAGWPRRPR